MARKPQLCRVRAYSLPGLPRPTISQVSFVFPIIIPIYAAAASVRMQPLILNFCDFARSPYHWQLYKYYNTKPGKKATALKIIPCKKTEILFEFPLVKHQKMWYNNQ
jgi:hypothetical protein